MAQWLTEKVPLKYFQASVQETQSVLRRTSSVVSVTRELSTRSIFHVFLFDSTEPHQSDCSCSATQFSLLQ